MLMDLLLNLLIPKFSKLYIYNRNNKINKILGKEPYFEVNLASQNNSKEILYVSLITNVAQYPKFANIFTCYICHECKDRVNS